MLFSEASFSQGRLDAKLIESLGEKTRVLTRGTVGATVTDDFHKLPPLVRFFAGGDRSVRGYDYNTLGPKDDSGDVVGGRYLLVGSVADLRTTVSVAGS